MALAFAGNRQGERMAMLEVFNPDNLMACLEAFKAGDVLVAVGDSTLSDERGEMTSDMFAVPLDAGRVVMGVFGGTVEVGSGDMFRLALL